MIFISHSSEDDVFVNKLRTTLRRNGYHTWVDHRDIPAGKFWDDVVEEALAQVDVMILVLSDAAIKSEYVAVEWREFKTTSKLLIPIRIQDCRPPLLIRHLQYIDFLEDALFDDQLQSLLRYLPAPTLPVNTSQVEVDEDEFEVARLRHQAQGLSLAMKGLIQENQLVFFLPDFEEKLIIDMSKEKVFIGWYDKETGMRPDLDLSRFNIAENGISRQHAMISRNGKGYTITDLSSRNGTYIDRQHLPLETPVALVSKSLLHLGTLAILVFLQE